MMNYRKDVKTGAPLSLLGFGCMRFPRVLGAIDMKKTSAMIAEAVRLGVNYFDTAWMYPGSEEALGAALEAARARKRVFIASKLPVILCRKKDDFDRYFNQTLARLRTDRVDYYLMHMLTDAASWERMKALGIEEWVREKRAAGAIRNIGFSFHGNKADFMRLLDAYDWGFCQIQYNYSDENYQAGRDGLHAAAARGLPVIVMEPLLGGKLADGLPKAAAAAFRRVDPDVSPAAWGLRWLAAQPEVTVILSGMSGIEQLRENARILSEAEPTPLSAEETAAFAEVKRVFSAANKVPCTACAYCMPCPRGVNIPDCFAAYNTSFAFSLTAGFQQYITSTAAATNAPHTAGLCARCGKCESHCPQNIPIRAALADVKRRMEPLWLRAILAVARRFLAGK
jgi:predicted aldo/keto reductase-like oxidoreductase